MTYPDFCRLCGGKNLTAAEAAALEPYRVRRAVFMAAGFGSRMAPVTLTAPKPLVTVNGVRLIDTLLDAVLAAGIRDITIVRGHLGEQFDALTEKYPMLRLLDNPYYSSANNISSAWAARDLLAGAYLLEADLLLANPALITPYQYRSNYLGVPVAHTDDWCFETDSGRIIAVRVGGNNCHDGRGCHHMFGISYWTPADGARLAGHLEQAFSAPGGKELYWDLVPLRDFAGEYDIYVRECSFSDITEIDTLAELIALDSSYAQYL
ncbi:MAG: phosphocholine cytidylyltransferase family protein [Oscillospiraceae bacterium]|nr:phosphocholine cytidylyltransferase family protein [Oscillospiraceae bacterium]